MQSISRWVLGLCRRPRGGGIIPGAHRCYPPSPLANAQLKPTASDLLNRPRRCVLILLRFVATGVLFRFVATGVLFSSSLVGTLCLVGELLDPAKIDPVWLLLDRFCNELLRHHLGISKNNQVKLDQTNNGMDQPENGKEISDVQNSNATVGDDMWPTGMWHASIIEKSTHHDGAMYKEDWGYWGQGCPINLADRTETVSELKKVSKGLPCYPDQEHCITHLPDEMLQIFSMMLAKTPINSGSIQLYGYLAVRDYMDGHLNYIFNHSRDNPVVVQQGSFIYMTGPRRGILMLSEVLIEFDMRIKTGDKDEEDLQLIDGLVNLNERISRRPFPLRFNGSSGGAVDMCLALIHQGMEAVIDVLVSVDSALDLALSSCVSIMDEHKEIRLFHGTVGESCQKRFVVAVPVDTVMRLKFEVGKKGAKNDEVHFCSFDTTQHECVNRQIKFEAACISVHVTVLPPLS